MIRLLSLLICLYSLPATAQVVVADLSQRTVPITASFDGSEILIFGAVRREPPLLTLSAVDVIITVAGPSAPMTVRKKARRWGIWVNTEAVEYDAAPSFYSVVSTGPLAEILSQTENLRHNITIERAIRAVDARREGQDVEAFSEAMIRIGEKRRVYALDEGGVDLQNQTLFRTTVALPANLVEGDYTTRIFLVRDGEIISKQTTTLTVTKVGLEKFLYRLAHDQPLIYGLLSLAIAIAAGWGASAIFRYIR